MGGNVALAAALQNRRAEARAAAAPPAPAAEAAATTFAEGELCAFDPATSAFHFNLGDSTSTAPRLAPDAHSNADVDVVVPLAPCVYRMTDYTYAKKEPISLERVVNKLGVLRCLLRECDELNRLIWGRISPRNVNVELPDLEENGAVGHRNDVVGGTMEEEELSKSRFMELLSSCGVYQSVSELVLTRCHHASENVSKNTKRGGDNPYRIPRIRVDGLSDFLRKVEELVSALAESRKEIEQNQTVCFHPGLGELYSPGAPLLCFPEGMEGTPLGVTAVQSWYDEETNRTTGKIKRKFVLVVEFAVSVGTEVAFVAASEVFNEFPEGRSLGADGLSHRVLRPDRDGDLLDRLQKRGRFYASVATDSHYLEYHPNAFFPAGGWGTGARPLGKSGRVMVDAKRGYAEGHVPIRGSSDGMSDAVKEAMRMWDQSKRTGVRVPFRTAVLDGSGGGGSVGDEDKLWMCWPMLTGFSFTARCWGKILLGLPKPPSENLSSRRLTDSPSRPSVVKLGIRRAALGGAGECGNVNYIRFHDRAFEQLVLEEEKKELIRAVARNAGGGTFDDDESDEEEEEEIGLDVVANKGAASIFLLSGPPGCGKTLTAEAIAELLKKPLYVVTAGDLGTTAAELEKSLGGVLDLCSTWDALVLIDEADIFLEARSSTEIQRNSLVCVMLRLLEYYSGCLFLSSNREAANIDAAIASRITVMLNYPPLDLEGRAKVWKNLTELVPTTPVDENGEPSADIANNPRKLSKYRVSFTEEDYHHLAASFSLNGRQIKNSIVLARALARERGVSLSIEILQRAVTAVAGDKCASGVTCRSDSLASIDGEVMLGLGTRLPSIL